MIHFYKFNISVNSKATHFDPNLDPPIRIDQSYKLTVEPNINSTSLRILT